MIADVGPKAPMVIVPELVMVPAKQKIPSPDLSMLMDPPLLLKMSSFQMPRSPALAKAPMVMVAELVKMLG